jgi:hypothetical protein
MRNLRVATSGDLEISIREGKSSSKISVCRYSLMPHMDMQVIPDEAILFSGTEEEFIDFLTRAKKKFGHLYKHM